MQDVLLITWRPVSYTHLVNRKPRFICIEDLNVSGMMKNRHLSKAVQEQGFFWFRKQLECKCNDKGIQLIVADRFYPSSKLCSCCGNIKKDLKLSDRVYRCECGNMICLLYTSITSAAIRRSISLLYVPWNSLVAIGIVYRDLSVRIRLGSR